jgi:hypothetical protein
VVGYFIHILQSRREGSSRIRRAKDEFLVVVADQRAKFDSMRYHEAEFFEQSVPAFTRAVYGIQHFVPAAQWTRLHAILQEYQSRHKSEFEGGRTRLIAAFSAEAGIGKTHSQTLREFLDRFDEGIQKSA